MNSIQLVNCGFNKMTLLLILRLQSSTNLIVISSNRLVNWLPTSCDLIPLDLLWGYVKSLIYTDKLVTINALEALFELFIGIYSARKSGPQLEVKDVLVHEKNTSLLIWVYMECIHNINKILLA